MIPTVRDVDPELKRGEELLIDGLVSRLYCLSLETYRTVNITMHTRCHDGYTYWSIWCIMVVFDLAQSSLSISINSFLYDAVWFDDALLVEL